MIMNSKGPKTQVKEILVLVLVPLSLHLNIFSGYFLEQLFSLIPTFSYGVALATELLLQVMANGVRHFAQNRF